MFWTCDFILAIVLLLAATLKARQLFAGSATILPGLLHNPLLLALLIQSEFLLAIWLLVGGFARLRFIAAVTCFSIFAFVSGYEAMHAMASCGCFGDVKVPPAATAGLDVAAVVALWATRGRPSPRPSASTATLRPGAPGEGDGAVFAPMDDRPSRRRLVAGIIAAVLLSGGLWGVFFFRAAGAAAAPTGGLVVLEPADWVNKPFPLLDEIEGGDPLRTGKWLAVLYHYDCDDCLKAIPDYQTLAASQSNYRLAFIAMPPFAPAGREPVADSADYLRLRLKTGHEWFATTPVVVKLWDGRVLAAAEGAEAVQPPDWR